MEITLQELVAAADDSRPAAWLATLANRSGRAAADTLRQVADLLAYPVMAAADVAALTPLFDRFDYTAMAERLLIVAEGEDGQLLAVLGHPLRPGLGVWLADRHIGELRIADPQVVLAALESHEAALSAVADAVGEEAVGEAERDASGDLTFTSIQGETSPAVRLINSTVFDALRLEASDIHLESLPQGLLIKFRIDGVLNRIAMVNNPALGEQAIARIKVLADLDIGEKRIPQDGRFRVASKGRDIDIRVSIMPSIHGEDAVLRVLDKKALMDSVQRLTLDSLGYDSRTITLLRRLAAEPYGMMLVTGPTGSGKTTTLYAALTEINHGADKVITIEDPVEYQLPGVLQIPVNEKKGLTFAVGLRSILRHDPDKILVGEIRDPETAQIAVQSALTGHMVFTSVHANNTFDVIGRFMHMGVDPYNFVSSLTGVVAQRLLRQNCPHCSEPVEIGPELLLESGVHDPHNYAFKAGRGCSHCRHTGYRGRRAIAEVLRLTDEIREMIVARASIRSLKEQARVQGTRFLRDVALDLVREGHTTLQEVNRVTFVA
ncbi:GspE/PulE family protein [Pseudoduganella armeniaca]|uniref:General secretion pathway protein GspE n=1 Tax=Pseudoduganella armeniaca TaxID=2072590 RepID=A0A2R4C6M5_9BURK|nr:GspE/PulE family protein [Pseudoduganella armeniaca]AVR95255.1 general secretion pathway protein GspE [Pseudoduganella armeniaca]